jgi:hypothetical protein
MRKVKIHRTNVCQMVFLLALAAQAIDRGAFGPFRRSLNSTGYGYRIEKDPTGKSPSGEIEVFEVRPGDSGKDEYYDDAQNDRERSELSEIGKDQAAGSEHWYCWYIYFPENYRNIYPVKVTLGQFHQKDSHPAWMFENADGGYWLYEQISGRTGKTYPLIDEAGLRGKWHQIELHIRWSEKDDGFFTAWINGEPKVEYRGQTMSAERVYFKYGLYRAFVSRYRPSPGTEGVPAQTVYYTGVKRGPDRQSVQP